MKVTKQQKVYLGLLGIGLVAFALDRLVFTPPSASAADTASDLLVAKPSKPAAHSAPVATAGKSVAQSTSNPVAQRLAGLSESMKLASAPAKDVFTPAAAWSGKSLTAVLDSRSFEQAHQLTGVILSDQRAAAMIDGRLVMVGQMVDGYKLVSVVKGGATFQLGETTVILHHR